jgi:translocation and assembly module TamB
MALFSSFIRASARMAASVMLVALAFVPLANAAEEDKGVLANLISRALSSPATSVSIGAVDGALSSDASIRDIVLSDRDGPWLKVDRVRLVWNRLALLRKRLEVDQLTIDHLQFFRRPVAVASESQSTPDATASAPGSNDALTLPELPVKVIIKQFAVQELLLGAPISGVAARLSIAGKATLGPPAEGLDLHLDAHRLDAPGVFSALLGFVPATKVLTLNLDFDEPAGGLAAHFANIPGAPPIKLTFGGSGPLDSFDAKLDFAAGPDIGASGQVNLAREGSARRLMLDLKSRLEGLMPGIARPVFAGETTLEGEMSINDDSSVSTRGLHLVSASARLDIQGGASADQQLDLKIHAGAIPGDVRIGKLDLNATLKGPLAGPKIDSVFDAGQIKFAEGTLDRVTAAFTAAPDGLLSEAATRIALSGQAEASGLALAEPALDQAIGGNVKLTVRGAATPVGAVTFDVLDIAAPALDASYSGLLSPSKIQGKLTLDAPDLARFAELAGNALKGEVKITADLEGMPRRGALSATLDARATHFASGNSTLDKIIGGELALTGAAQILSAGGIGFHNLVATGAHGSARLDGAVGRDKADLKAGIDVPQARFIDPAISGAIQIAAALSGALDHLDATLKASLGDGRLLDRPTSGLTLEARATDITGLIAAHASLSGDIDRQPLTSSANLSRQADGGWVVSDLGLHLGSAHLEGNLVLGADQLASGKLNLAAANLDDLSPLLLTKLSGAVQASASLTSVDARQNAAISMRSDRLAVGANSFSGVNVDMTLRDVWGAKIGSGVASISGANFAGQSIADLKFTAKGGADSTDLDFSATARGVALKAGGNFFAGRPSRLELATLSARGNGQSLALATPTTLTFDGDGVDAKNILFSIGGGRLSLAGHAGHALDLRTSLVAIPLSAADLVARGLGLSGVADGEAAISGTLAEPSGDWRLRLKGLSAPQTRAIGLPSLDVTGSGRLGGNRTSLDVAVNAGIGNAVRLTGSAPLASDGALDVKVVGKLDAGLANNTLSVSGRHVAGAVAVNVQIRGAAGKPRAEGSLTLANGSFRDDETGLKLAAINAQISASGDVIKIERMRGATPNGGEISASGQVTLDPAGGFPGSIHLAGQHAQLVATDMVSATADLTLDVTGALAQTPHIAGHIAIVSMDISVPENLGGVAAPIPGTKHINPNATARARLALEAKATSGRASAPAFNATLAMTISAPSRVFVRGRGINAELSGDLRVSGAAASPQIAGGFDLRRGSLSLLGKRLEFTRGRIQFHGDAMPELDLLAQTSAGDVTARIEVTGPASKPVFTFSSEPNLPQDEILSRVLFQKPSGNLSPFQALQLANAVSSLTGGGDAFESLRKSLGVDSLDIGSSASGSPTVGISRAINDRISIGAKTGAKPEDNGVSVDFDVTRHIRLQAGVDASGGSSVGVGAEWEYK